MRAAGGETTDVDEQGMGAQRSGADDVVPSADELEALLGRSPDPLLVWEADGSLAWANAAGVAALGMAVDPADPSAVFRSGPGHDLVPVAAALAPGAVAGPQVALVQAAGGRRRWWEWSARRDLDGRLYVSACDVTELRRAESSALRGLIGAVATVVVKDCRGRVVFSTASGARDPSASSGIGGPSTSSGTGGPSASSGTGGPSTSSGTGDGCGLDPEDAAVVATGEPSTTDRVVTECGRTRTELEVRFALRGADGEVTHVASLSTDISDRAAVERELAARRRLLDTVIRTSPDAVALVGPGGQLTEISDAAFTCLGLTPPASAGDLLARLHPADEPAFRAWLASVAGGEQVAPLRCRAAHVGGRTLVFDANAIPTSAGADVHGVVVWRDVTEVVAVEAELQRAVVLAEQEQHARAELLARMGSQLQVPLRAVMDAAGQLEATPFPAPLDGAVRHVLRAGGHLADLVDEVLQVAEVDGGASTLVLRPVPLGVVAADAMQLVRPLADRQGLRLLPSEPADLAAVAWPWVLADRQRLLQVLLNLLSNAVKYNRPSGSVRLSVSVHGDRARLAVSDTGRGIAVEHLPKLFEPFERLGAEHSAIEGTGVGLTLTKRLVEQMGGTVEVQSVVGAGSVFVVELCASAPGADAGQAGFSDLVTPSARSTVYAAPHSAPAGASSAIPGTATAPGQLRVLHIDDDETCAELVRHILARRPGVELQQADDGARALALARRSAFDLVLLDVDLPDVSGDTVLHRLRGDPATADVPVVVVSADATDAQVARSMAAGATAYLTKPLVVAELLAVVDALSAEDGR